jgi:hypothetical protein
MPTPGPAPSRLPRPAQILPGIALLAAAGWLVSRVWLGLDFTDEMQYYGEIEGLVRTGKFFQDDLFLQQLGYVFVWPFFKLHALLFPDLDFLILFGRLLLLTAYGATGAMFWRATGKLGGFTLCQKLAALSVFLAWVPFQLFAFSYNTTSYLLIVALVSVWVRREAEPFSRYPAVTGVLLTMLAYTYPPAGFTFILVAVIEAAWRLGRRPAVNLLLATVLGGATVGLIMRAIHGADFFPDLFTAIAFTKAFGVGLAIRRPDNLGGWVTSLVLGGIFLWRLRRGRPFEHPWGADSPPLLRWAALCLVIAGGGALLGLSINWVGGFFSVSAYLGLLLLLAASVAPADGYPAALRLDNTALLRRTMLAAVGTGIVALLVVIMLYLHPGTGYFAHTIFLILLVLLALGAESGPTTVPAGLAIIGTFAGAVFSFTSGNGLHNFGIGAASVIPFLVLVLIGRLDHSATGRLPLGTAAIAPALVALFLINAALHPYAEQKPWHRFFPVTGVPAYRGIWTSPVKIAAVEKLRALAPSGTLQGRRVLVIGPQPWLYFVLGGQPATPMFFMHFDGHDAADRIVADRLFRGGMPDCIVLSTTTLPPPIATPVLAWSRQSFQITKIILPADFVSDFLHQTRYRFSPEVFLLERERVQP